MPTAILLLSVVIVSLNPVWIQRAIWAGASPPALTLWQAVFAALLYGTVGLVRRPLLSVQGGRYPRLLLVGAAFFSMALCFSLSLERLDASYTVMLFFSYPLFVLLGNTLIFRTRLSRGALAALLLLIAGVAVITWPQGRPESLPGVLLALGASLSHAAFILYTGHYTKDTHPLQLAMFAQFGFFASSFVLLPFLPPPVLFVRAAWQYGFILAFLSSLLGFVLFVKGVAGLGANRAALISVTNLPLSLLFTWLFLGDTPGMRLILGFFIILAGLILEASASIGRIDDAGGSHR